MSHTIRQQTHLRSPLVRTAERGLAKPADRQPRPLNFIIDGTACTDDTLIYPRTTRQAFGHYASDPAPKRITFLQRGRTGWAGVAAVIAILIAFALT